MPSYDDADQTYRALMREASRKIVTDALAAHDGHIGHTARALGMYRTSLVQVLRRLGIDTHKEGTP